MKIYAWRKKQLYFGVEVYNYLVNLAEKDDSVCVCCIQENGVFHTRMHSRRLLYGRPVWDGKSVKWKPGHWCLGENKKEGFNNVIFLPF